MLLICWNVAGWATTLPKIREHYGTLNSYLDRLGADILCLQEAKLLAAKVAEDPRACGAREEGWEVAWSLYRPAAGGAAAAGNGRSRAAGTWNGVCTFARSGLLAAADPDPLGAPEFDCEGRCLLTDHGAFVLFNAYVPTSGSHAAYGNIPFKMRYLRALRAAMRRQRAAGRAVILAGDLNLARRAADVPWRERVVELARVFRDEDGAAPYAQLAPPLAAKLRSWASGVRGVLAALQVVTVAAKGAAGGSAADARKAESFKVVWRAPDGRTVQLGKATDSRDAAEIRWGLRADGVSFPDPDDAAAPRLVARAAGILSVGALAEIVTKALAHPFCEAEQRALAAVAATSTSPCLLAWAESLITEDGMVDSFAAVHPDAEERFTCWEQYSNARYENGGARIDYLFVDGPLWAARGLAGAPLSTGGKACAPASAEAARAAATAGGAWQPAPFDGSGIPDPPLHVFDTQFEADATGIRYMPPRYSDHTAITLLLADAAEAVAPLALRQDAATLRAMPQRQSRSITSFFAPRAPGSAAAEAAEAAGASGAAGASLALVPAPAAGSGKKRAAPPPLPPGQKSVKDMFGKRPQ